MPIESEQDPFTQVFQSIWALAYDHKGVQNIVRLGNQIDFSKNIKAPLKQHIQDADIPEIILVSTGIESANLHETSSSSLIVRTYDWLISTGDLRIQTLMGLEFELIRAFADWKNVLGALRWKDAAFVKSCQLLGVSEGQSDPERNRGIKGWSALMSHRVTMHFKTNDLKAGAS